MADVREYLRYSIKHYKLARKYSWGSVFQYDNELRILQHTYGHHWSMNHSHIHKVMLIPRWAVEGKTQRSNSNITTGSAGFSSHTAAGGEICRNCNHPKGCQKATCQFAHVCNRRVDSQDCGKAHAGHTHFVSISQGQWLADFSPPLNNLKNKTFCQTAWLSVFNFSLRMPVWSVHKTNN